MPDNFFAETEQVAFMTQNVPPGIDFSNDPLLQGRNFSYLDTQLKRLGGPNFTHIPINAPKCPFHHFQQDGHMAMRNPVGRVNYQPNSFGEGPRESPERGFRSFAGAEEGPKQRLRAESFADHYSQARQFFNSQTAHRAAPYRDGADVRTEQGRDASHSRADGLASPQHRRGSGRDGRRQARHDEAAEAGGCRGCTDATIWSRLRRSASSRTDPASFEGRKVGVLVSAGADAALLKRLQDGD